jgi:alpha-L-glutamate ligase-like protein
MILNQARRLRDKGVLGMNQRNAEYTLRYNPRHLYPLVDDKLRTKRLAESAGMAVPELYAVVEIERQIASLPALLGEHGDFVIKPARGSGGNGILVITGRSRNRYRKASGILMDEGEIAHHLSNILSGMYSLGGQPDRALIEYRVQFAPVFERITYLGVPDIRIIVFLGVPVMSMVRLPTHMSDGKANLHQGAIGAGIDIATGQTLTAVWRNDIVTEHPDTGEEVTGIQVPYWDRLLELAARCYELTGLGYVGVDIVLDREKGPLVLELNARPGLNIQIANGTGLLPCLQSVERNGQELADAHARVLFAKQHFGHPAI